MVDFENTNSIFTVKPCRRNEGVKSHNHETARTPYEGY